MRKRHSATPVPFTLVGILVGASLTGCAMANEFGSHEKEQSFATLADAPPPGEGAFAPPEFVPADATALRMRITTNGPSHILRFSSPAPLDAQLCTPGPLTGEPPLDSTWWPIDVPADGTVCDTWQVFDQGGTTYAWTSA
ncbi:MAG TPA: hypothetical protein VGP24_01205 [Glaciihabitans sp.]|jgi:hypothetical protein|nr:hypothetical protein [Glaciihabitans sp.]